MDDLISRQVAIDAILHNQEVYSNNFGDNPIDRYTVAIIDNDVQTIAQLPSAERVGKWIDMNTSTTMYMPRYKCSICNEWASKSNYCPNCGARMEVKNELMEKP